uniref:MARVEL domain-containing protein n=1 Tax=Pan troglodytes TaxID=9598 RepID=A0A2I3SZV6_PANTR
MAEFPSKVSTRTSSPAQDAGALRTDLGFLVLELLVWALIADTPYHLYPAYGWVMFVSVFLWLVTIVFFTLYLFQLHMKLYMVPWPLVLMMFNVSATLLYVTAFIACSAAVDLTSLKGTQPYNQRAATSLLWNEKRQRLDKAHQLLITRFYFFTVLLILFLFNIL